MKPLRLTNLYFLTIAGNKMHSSDRKSSFSKVQGLRETGPLMCWREAVSILHNQII